jgi:hypothetical protein
MLEINVFLILAIAVVFAAVKFYRYKKNIIRLEPLLGVVKSRKNWVTYFPLTPSVRKRKNNFNLASACGDHSTPVSWRNMNQRIYKKRNKEYILPKDEYGGPTC